MKVVRGVGFVISGFALVTCGGGDEGNGAAPQGSPKLASIAAGGAGGCVIRRDDGRVLCWDGEVVSLPEGAGEPTKPAVELPQAQGVRAISIGHEACAITPENSLRCWTLPPGLSTGAAMAEFTELTLTDVSSVAVGSRHACAVAGGEVVCWGGNEYGAVDGTMEPRDGPVTVAGVGPATAVAVGETASCALTTSGDVICWGSSPFEARTPTPRPELAGATQIAVGYGALGSTFVCALRKGQVTCVGAPYDVDDHCRTNASACGDPPICSVDACPPMVDPAMMPFEAYTVTLPDDAPYAYSLQISDIKLAVSLGVSVANESLEDFFFPRAPMARCNGNGREGVFDVAVAPWDTTCVIEQDPARGERVFCWGLGSTYVGNTTNLCTGAEIVLPP